MAFWIFIVAVAAYVAAAAYTDFRMQRIPNYLTVPMAIAGLVCSLLPQWVLPGYPTTPANCLLGFALGFAIFFLPFALGGGGSGDLKLVAALGAWLGWLYLLFALAVSLIFALVLAMVVWSVGFPAGGGNRSVAKPKAGRRRALPFAIPMALGAWCILGGIVWKELRPDIFQQSSRSVPAEQRT